MLTCEKCGEEVILCTIEKNIIEYEIDDDGNPDWNNPDAQGSYDTEIIGCKCGCVEDIADCPWEYDNIQHKVINKNTGAAGWL